MPPDEIEAYVQPTCFVDSDHPRVVERGRQVTAGAPDDRVRAVRLYDAVRDGIRYDPSSITADPSDYRASNVVDRAAASCMQAVDGAAPARPGEQDGDFIQFRCYDCSIRMSRRSGSERVGGR